MIILKTWWFGTSHGSIGVVGGEDGCTKRKKAYIGAASGTNEKRDAADIASSGCKVSASVLKEILGFLES